MAKKKRQRVSYEDAVKMLEKKVNKTRNSTIYDYDADLSIEEIAKNDGLTMQDFGGWFGEIQRDKICLWNT